jgi:hypothetical protein
VVELSRRRALLRAALGFLQIQHEPPQVASLRRWLDSWAGIGAIAEGMYRQGFDVSLTQYDERGWRATFSGDQHGVEADGGAAGAGAPTVTIDTRPSGSSQRHVRPRRC